MFVIKMIIKIAIGLLLLPFRLVLGGRGNMAFLPEDDEKMELAKKKAIEKLPFFFEKLRQNEGQDFALKIGFKTSTNDSEFIWFNEIRWEGEALLGVCNNDPRDIEGLNCGDVKEINLKNIADWSFVCEGKTEGHYTTKVLLPLMNKKQKRQYMEVLGWTEEDLEFGL